MAKIIRFADYEQKSRNPDAVSPRDPSDSALIIILPQVISRPIPEPGQWLSPSAVPY